ncbi:hypothetical protein J2T10_000767 [Paenarthrobacter nicotinovorans]|uniref:DUF3800 domain-containing protein n=1 Tax=Paenarthrobacter nicotinovorans TaxID=29320 RepID=A0ABT9THL4_PAENI|nr:DUF3800 domain-containing protein [Paenarthrobacter nicotinovorans]MDQ0101148.1 hypothetical protein [Paenarthrobacter nicotinovorans]
MLAAFVDESERDEAFYFLGALVCTQEQYDFITAQFEQILDKHGRTFSQITAETEFHAYELMSGKGAWKGIPLRLRIGIYHEALRVIEASGACMHLEGIDVAGHLARGYKYPTPARELALSHLFERINDCAKAKGETVKVYADDHHTSEISRSNFTQYQAWGTYGYKSSKLEALHEGFEFIDSKLSRALQASDLVTYLYNRWKTVEESDPRAVESKALMWADIVPAVRRGSQRIWP